MDSTNTKEDLSLEEQLEIAEGQIYDLNAEIDHLKDELQRTRISLRQTSTAQEPINDRRVLESLIDGIAVQMSRDLEIPKKVAQLIAKKVMSDYDIRYVVDSYKDDFTSRGMQHVQKLTVQTKLKPRYDSTHMFDPRFIPKRSDSFKLFSYST